MYIRDFFRIFFLVNFQHLLLDNTVYISALSGESMYIHVDVEYVRNLRFNGFNFFLLGFTQHASFSCFSDQSRKVQCCAHYLWICDEGQVSLVEGMLKLCIILYYVRTAFQNKNKTRGGKTFEQYCTHNLHVSSCEVSPPVFNLQ